jgi:3-deoxy-D-arabino-heptulosonate 7-phosphate (DAHP) synthase
VKLVSLADRGRRQAWDRRRATNVIRWATEWVCKGSGPIIDLQTMEVKEAERSMVVERGVIVTREMRQAMEYAKLVREAGVDIDVTGAMKHTFVKYQTQGAPNTTWLSSINLQAMTKVRGVLTGSDSRHQVFIVDD